MPRRQPPRARRGLPYGETGAEYRTELNSFARIRQQGSLSSPTSCFTIEDKEGTITTLGGCNDAGAVATLGTDQPWSWEADIVADRQGNEIDYDYAVVDGEHVLSVIYYTGYEGVRGDRLVHIETEPRQDPSSRYQVQHEIRSTRRLSAITTYAGATLARRYELDYRTSQGTGRSLLRSVTMCAAAQCTETNSLPPTTFDYQDSPLTFSDSYLGNHVIHPVGDYDGDGTRDRMRRNLGEISGYVDFLVMSSTGQSLSLNHAVTPWGVDTDGDNGLRGGSQVRLYADFDRDGRSDLERWHAPGEMFAVASWNSATQQPESRASALSFDDFERIEGRADFNADGLTDLLVEQSDSLVAYLQCPDNPPDRVDFCGAVDFGHLAPDRKVYGVDDYDGNGYADVYVNEGIGCNDCVPHIRFGNPGGVGSHIPVALDSMTIGVGPGYIDEDVRIADINGDGMPDLIDPPRSGVPGASAFRVALNEGGRLGSDGRWEDLRFRLKEVDHEPFETAYDPRTHALVADVDVDGRAEVLVPREREPGSEWCFWDDTIEGGAEPDFVCTSTGDYHFDATTAQFDRTIYKWSILDVDLQSDGSLAATVRTMGNLGLPLSRTIPDDHDGDGDIDFKYGFDAQVYGECQTGDECLVGLYIGEASELPQEGSHLARTSASPDLLVGVTDGLGAQEVFSYAPLSHAFGDSKCELPEGERFYSADFANAPRDGEYALVASSMRVVARHESSNGVGSRSGTCYRYRDGWRNLRGRGFATFGTIAVEQDTPGDAANDLRTTTLYEKDWPRTGAVIEEYTHLRSDEADAAPLSHTTNHYKTSCYSGDGSPEFCKTALQWTRTETTDLETRAPLTVREVTRAFSAQDWLYGNVSSEADLRASEGELGHNHEVTTDYEWGYDGGAWWIDRLNAKTETYAPMDEASPLAAPGDVKSVRTAWTYYTSGNGVRKPEYERIQQGIAGQNYESVRWYDQFGNVLSFGESDPDEPDSVRWTVSGFTTDGYFRAWAVNPEGHSTHWNAYDARFGLAGQVVDPAGNDTTIVYDDFGRTNAIYAPGQQPKFHGLVRCTASGVECPERAVMMEFTVQPGSPTTQRYVDMFERPVQETTAGFELGSVNSVFRIYDVRGREVAVSPPTEGTDPDTAYFERSEDFDPLGRRGRKVQERPSPTPDEVTTYEYEGLTTKIRLPGAVDPILRTYDGHGRLIEVVDAAAQRAHYRYDARGELALIQDANGNAIELGYDDRGRRLWVSHPDRGDTEVVYNGLGLRRDTYANGTRVHYEYDKLGRPLRRYIGPDADIVDAEWSYDDEHVGNLDWVRGGTDGVEGYCRGYRYDTYGRVRYDVSFVDGHEFAVESAYDATYGRLKAMRYPSGGTYELSYTNTGALARERELNFVASRTVHAMNAFGAVTKEEFTNGLRGEYEYDPSTGRATVLQVGGFNQVPNGLPGATNPVVQRLEYKYDHPLGLLSERINHQAGVTETFTYDELSRLTEAIMSNGWAVSYEYDNLGNLTRKDDYTQQIRYGESVGPHQISSYTAPDGSVVDDFEYDANGNLTRGDGLHVEYDDHGRPFMILRESAEALYDDCDGDHCMVDVYEDLAYTPSGELYRRTSDTTTYYVDRLFERMESSEDGGATERDYIGKMVFSRPAGSQSVTATYHLPDELGSPAVIMGTATANHWAYLFGYVRRGHNPFGGPRDGDWNAATELPGNSFTDRGFTGHRQMDGLDLIHMGGRAYDYNLGRFLSVDPFIVEPADTQSLNPYSYVRNNPLNAIDPTGYVEEEVKRFSAVPDHDDSMTENGTRSWRNAMRFGSSRGPGGPITATYTTTSNTAESNQKAPDEQFEVSDQLGKGLSLEQDSPTETGSCLPGCDSSAFDNLELDNEVSGAGGPRSDVDLNLQGTATSEVSGLPGAQNHLPEMTPEEMAVQIAGGAAIVGGVGVVAYGPAALAGASTGLRAVAARGGALTRELFLASALRIATLRELGPNFVARMPGLSRTVEGVLKLIVNNRFLRTPRTPSPPRFPTGFKRPVPPRGPPRPPHWDIGPN